MRVVFFSKGGRDVPSSRYRCFMFADALEAEGFETRIVDPPPMHFGWRVPRAGWRELVRLGRQLRKAESTDILYLQRPTHNNLFVLQLALLEKLRPSQRIVFDFCDPLWIHSPRKTEILTRLADLVVVSCEDLAQWARRHNRNVQVIPNSIAPGARAERPSDRCVFGWVGNAAVHFENLMLLVEALRGLKKPVRIKLIGTSGATEVIRAFESLAGVELEAIDWIDPDRVEDELATLDVALLPVEDTTWNRKLLTKLIEYLAAGLPVIASPVGDNRFAIQNGENGFLASAPTEWAQAIETLASDGGLRRRLGEGARRTAETRYSIDVNGPKLAAALRDTFSIPGPRCAE